MSHMNNFWLRFKIIKYVVLLVRIPPGVMIFGVLFDKVIKALRISHVLSFSFTAKNILRK